ncbi:MAG: bifunctional response regulator/alkaline phosphatase family protein [Candidatus Delongbacteria bacterium]|nr:bifunctional response regulator/alkaline phosphatase family protein [Candidatus Delongbacteria bacterium]
MTKKILWIDDEIHYFRSHIEFLKNKGYEITPVANGDDGLDLIQRERYDMVLLDEMMIGMDGLETLARIRKYDFNVPVVMITKNEEETLMDSALSHQVTDFLTKPVNPSQILSVFKKVFDGMDLMQQKSVETFHQDFNRIRQMAESSVNSKDWIDLYLEILKMDILNASHRDDELKDVFKMQKEEINQLFSRFIEANYAKMLISPGDLLFSHHLMPKVVFPHLRNGEKVYFFLLDCMRADQWLAMSQSLSAFFNVDTRYYFSILPTATPYSRNSIFSGKLPLIIQQKYPKLVPWFQESETGKNDNEYDLMLDLLEEYAISLQYRPYFTKILDMNWAEEVYKKMSGLKNLSLIVFVFNFLDIIIHNRAANKILQEIVLDETAFRNIAKTWFENSWIFRMLQYIFKNEKATVVITTDHGSIFCNKPTVIKGDSRISYSLRFKIGNYLSFNTKHGWLVKDPEKLFLPRDGVLTNYAFANNNNYFAFTGNVGQFSQKYNNNFLHGGISMEEMILPYAIITPKK